MLAGDIVQGLLRDVDDLHKTTTRPMPKYLMSQIKVVLIEELCSGFSMM